MGRYRSKKIAGYSDAMEELIQKSMEKKQNAARLIAATSKNIEECRRSGIDVSKPENLLEKARAKLNSAQELKDYDDTISYAGSASKLVIKLKDQHKKANEMLRSAKKMMTVEEKKGMTSRRPHNLIREAELAIRNGNYSSALDYSNKTVKLINSLKVQIVKASESVTNALMKINEAKAMNADTSEAERLFEEAKGRIENEDYEGAIKLAKECNASIIEAQSSMKDEFQQQTAAVITELLRDLEDAERAGADITRPREILQKAKTASQNHEVQVALDNIDFFKKALKEVRTQHSNGLNVINSADKMIEEAVNSGVNTEKAKQFLTSARQSLESHDYLAVKANIDSVYEQIEKGKGLQSKLTGLKEQAESNIETSRVRIKEAAGMGMNAAKQEALLKNAEAALLKKEYHQAQKYATQAVDEIDMASESYSSAKDTLQKIETSFDEVRMYFNVTEIEKLYTQSKSLMMEGNYSEANELATKVYDSIEDLLVNSLPVITTKFPETLTFKSGTWGKLQFEISNDGKVQVNDIELKITGEIETMGSLVIKILKAGERRVVNIGMRTNEIGEIPVNVGIVYQNPINKEQFDLQEVLWIKTERGEMGARMDTPMAAPAMAAAAPSGELAPEGGVKVLSEVEFFQGFIRLKVGLRNEQKTVITDAKLDLEFDETAMRLDFIEPDFERKGNRIIIGNIHPDEKRTIAFYLDPLICTESYVDGTLSFKDIYGELKTSAMKRRRAEIVCPIMYTTENINTAMLNRLISSELSVHDSKIYELPAGIDFKKASIVCKETVQAHDLKMVREFDESSDIDNPEIETWYYGMTKVKKNKVIIKASSRKKTNTIEMFVACNSKQVLTGFLAELGHNFNDKLKVMGLTTEVISPLTNTAIRAEINQTNSILNHHYSDKTTLSISKRGDEYEVSFKTSDEMADASELADFIKVSPGSRNDLVTQINDVVTVLNVFCATRGKKKKDGDASPEPPADFKGNMMQDKISDLKSFGQLLYGMFLPVPIQTYLEKVGEPLILKTNDNELPWELLHDDTDFLCLKIPIGRRLRSREIPRVNTPKTTDKIRILFIANATEDLEGAEEEVNYIVDNLPPEIEVDVLKRKDATSAAILSALRSGKYNVIHYAGHAEFNMTSPDESALISANENKIYAQQIKRLMGGRPLVFLNACSSGMEKMCEDGSSYTGSDTEGLASSFILGGSMAFIGASWPMPDVSAGILASEFYNKFLKGETVGESLRLARLHLKETRPDDINWMAFTLYGDPTIRLSK